MSSISSVISSVLDDYYSSKTSLSSSSSKSDSSSRSSTDSSTGVSYTTETSLGRYITSLKTSDDADAKTIFQKISLDMGGDGKTITKDQLATYISNAESGKISIPDDELNALKTIQTNWDDIADGGSNISYDSIAAAGYKDTLLSVVPSDETDSTVQSLIKAGKQATEDAYNYIMASALGNTTSSDQENTLDSLLKSVLTGTSDEKDDSNADLIDTLTNLIAKYNDATSTIETEA